MVDLGAATVPHRPPQRRQGEPLVEVSAQLPAPDAAGEHVHDDRQVDEVLSQADVGDVRDPDLIGLGDLQSHDQVGVAGEVVAAFGRPPPSYWGFALEAHLGHQAPDALAVDRPALTPEHLRQPSIAVGRPPGGQPRERPPRRSSSAGGPDSW
jgi:hypothetical protein